jgi:hypothetical protein
MHSLPSLACANSSNAREKVDASGTRFHIEKPQIRRSARSTFSRSISAVVVLKPSTALATNALAIAPRSRGGRPIPSQLDSTNSSIRTHSSVWITFSSFGVSGPTSDLSSGINSC